MLKAFGDEVPHTLIGFATQMASRFARPCFLVGSALLLPDPRDVDLRVVLSDDEFSARYGHHANYERGCWLPQHVPDMKRYWSDMAKLGEQGVLACRLNLDFQVHPIRFSMRFSGNARKRIDVCPDLTDPFNECLPKTI